MASTIGNLLVKIGSDITGLQQGLDKAERSLSKFSGKMSNIGNQLSMTLSAPLAGIGVAAISAAADFEKMEKGLSVIMGSSEAAAAELEKLRKAAEAPGLGFEQAVNSSIRLQAVGMAADDARETIIQMGNAIAMTGGSAEDLDAVTRQLTQMISKGRVLQEDFMVLQERMPKVGDAMDAAFGTRSIERVREMGISAEDFVKGITGAMGDFARVQGGLANSLENAKMAARSALADIGKSINENFDIQGIVERFGAQITRMVEWFGALTEGQRKALVVTAAVLAALGPLAIAIGNVVKVAQLAVMGFNGLLSVVALIASPVGLVVAGIVALAAGLAYAYKKSESFRATIHGVGAVLLEVVKIFGEAVSAFVRGFSELKDGEFKKAAGSFQEALVKANPVTMAFAQGKRLGAAYSDGYEKSLEKSREEKKFDPYEDKGALMAQMEDTGKKAGAAFSSGMSKSVEQALTSMPGKVSGFSQIWEGKSLMGAQSTAGISGMAKPMDLLLKQLDQARQKTVSWRDTFAATADSIAGGIQNAYSTIEGALGAIDGVFQQLFSNRQANIDATYEQERKRIEESKMSEEAKQAALQRLEEQTDAKRRKLARQQAIRDKLLGIIQATIATAVNVTRSLANPIMAAIVAAAGAAQIALIASQKIPALAKGGLAYGPQLAMVGDNPGARVDPEVIAPLSKLEGMFGRGGAQEVVVRGVISGRDLLLVQERATQDRLRTRGF